MTHLPGQIEDELRAGGRGARVRSCEVAFDDPDRARGAVVEVASIPAVAWVEGVDDRDIGSSPDK